jgi:hypothetical protein
VQAKPGDVVTYCRIVAKRTFFFTCILVKPAQRVSLLMPDKPEIPISVSVCLEGCIMHQFFLSMSVKSEV